MEKNTLSPPTPLFRPNSPLRSPGVRKHFAPIHADISYPADLFSAKPSYKQMAIGQDGVFRASVDVRDFKPEEISVKTVGHTVVIELSHGDKDDEFGTVSRKSVEKYVLPPYMNMDSITSWTSQDVLYVKVSASTSDIQERVVEIKKE